MNENWFIERDVKRELIQLQNQGQLKRVLAYAERNKGNNNNYKSDYYKFNFMETEDVSKNDSNFINKTNAVDVPKLCLNAPLGVCVFLTHGQLVEC